MGSCFRKNKVIFSDIIINDELDTTETKNNKDKYETKLPIFYQAALTGNIEYMIWLKNNNYYFDEGTMNAAIICGDLNNMIWLKNNCCLFDNDVYNYAIRKKI